MQKGNGHLFLSIKNWTKYQYYKTRNPPWIKLYYSLLDDDAFIALSPTHRSYYMMLLLVAARHDNFFCGDPSYLKKVLRLDEEPDLTPLFHSGLLHTTRRSHRAATAMPQRSNIAAETETETETEKTPPLPPLGGASAFGVFWAAYPKKRSKGQAEKAWTALKPSEQLQGQILAALKRAVTSVEWAKDGGRFIPHAATWLRAKGWEDELHDDPLTTWKPP